MLRGSLILALVLGLTFPVEAGNCHFIYRQQVVAPVVASYYVPGVHYSVGQQIQEDALAERIAQKVAEKIRASIQSPTPEALPIKTTPMLLAKCAKCHSGDDPKGGLTLDGSRAVTDRTFRDVVRMLGTGKGVPKAMVGLVAGLTPAEKGQLTEELIGLEISEEVPSTEGELK